MGKKKTIELSENQLDSIKLEILECKSNMEDNILTIGNLLLKVKSALGSALKKKTCSICGEFASYFDGKRLCGYHRNQIEKSDRDD